MIYVVPFVAAHFRQMAVQNEQQWLTQMATDADMRGLEGQYASTLMKDGKPLVCAGALEYWPGRALVWAFLSNTVDRRVFPRLHSEAKRFLDGLPIRRLEASVVVGFENGHRWVRALGFEVEAPLQRHFQADGQDCVGYVKIRGD